ncbi:hypothetical protein O6H91_12G030700 [Diphasiastrum complanatum]|uniref:Uncharacterized protein n=1 Tax=Diphasiastrum complanatum TaxID=34168 RepID=A0ACC2C035_DIPCM|nr:hypothetical protein O6H91_12G030700 [Diphasiastrum complanatum]
MDQHLCLAEYSYNSFVSTNTRVSPFLLAHGYAPLLPGVPLPPDDTPITISSFLSQELIARATTHLHHVQQRYQTSVNRHHRHVEFKLVIWFIFSYVLHDIILFKATLLLRSLHHVMMGLSPVTYRLQLLVSTRACDNFHVSMLRVAIEDDAPRDLTFLTDPELFPFLPAAIHQVRL